MTKLKYSVRHLNAIKVISEYEEEAKFSINHRHYRAVNLVTDASFFLASDNTDNYFGITTPTIFITGLVKIKDIWVVDFIFTFH